MSDVMTVVVAANVYMGERSYTAAVVRVQEADDLLGEDRTFALKKAESLFFNQSGQPWFVSLSRAKQFAALLAADVREKGEFEYEDGPIIEIDQDEDRLYTLSRRGNRKPEDSVSRIMARCAQIRNRGFSHWNDYPAGER